MQEQRFSAGSDVWSFGVVMVEVLLDGMTPYIGLSNPDVIEQVVAGRRHRQPDCCPDEL